MLAQLDFVFFIYGLSFLLLAMMVYGLASRPGERLAWRWLAGFGLLHGINEWLDMLAVGLADSPAFKWVRLSLMLASFLPLVEFGRLGLKVQGRYAPGRWVFLPLIGLVAVGTLAGISGLNAVGRYALGLPGGLLAGVVLLRESRLADAASRRLIGLTGAAFMAYAPATGLIVPASSFFPASTLNQEAFLAATGCPIQLIRAFCATAAAIGIWLVYRQGREPAGETRWFHHWLFPGAVVLLAAGGFWFTGWRGQIVGGQQNSRLLSQATAIAGVLNVQDVKALSFHLGDKDSPPFKRMRGQMRAYAQALMPVFGPETSYLSIYSMALREGAIVFGPESIDAEDSMASAPGTPYVQPPAVVREVFQSRLPRSTGPYKDEYGTFVSAFAPVLDTRTHEVVLVVGMDIAATSWQAMVSRERFVAILFTLGLTVLLLASSTLLQWRHRLSVVRQQWLIHAEAMIAVIVGLGVTLLLAYLAGEGEARSRHQAFSHVARMSSASVIDTMCNIRDDQLEDLGCFFEVCPRADQKEFHAYAEHLARHPAVRAWEWVPAVRPAATGQVEDQARSNGLADSPIWQKDSQGNRTPATGRDVYYPVCFVEPLAGNERAVGYDLGSDPAQRAALEEAVRTGLPMATDPVTLVQEAATQKGSLVYRPVLAAGTPASLRGLVVAVLGLESVLRQTHLDRSAVTLDLWQLQVNESPRFLASSSPERSMVRKAEGQLPSWSDERGFAVVTPLFVFGKTYALVAHPGPGFLATYQARAGWLTLTIGSVLTVMLAGFIGFLGNRQAYLEQQVLARTEELRQSRNDLEAKVRERTSQLQLANRRLEATIGELQRSYDELTNLTHAAAHDLKTPLRTIGTLMDWLATDYGDRLDEEGKRYVQVAKGRAYRLTRLLESMLLYADIGRPDTPMEDVDLDRLVAEVIGRLKPSKTVQITVATAMPRLQCHRTHLAQVFRNLLDNAVKYMDKPDGRIIVSCSEHHYNWLFSVSDTGPGIEQRYFEKIFQIFQTLSPRDQTEDIGIGLTVAKKIVELYDGKIWVKSEVGKGSTFYFTYPKAMASGPDEKSPDLMACI